MLKLFTTHDCTQCPIVINALDGMDIVYESVSAENNPEEASKHGIMSVPSLVDEDGGVHIGTGACLAYLNS